MSRKKWHFRIFCHATERNSQHSEQPADRAIRRSSKFTTKPAAPTHGTRAQNIDKLIACCLYSAPSDMHKNIAQYEKELGEIFWKK